MKPFGSKVLQFYQELSISPEVPDQVEVLYPHQDTDSWQVMTQFYSRYYQDTSKRVFLIGINPGRFGAGTTGIPFTDPIRLKQECGIDHTFNPKPELSSKFVYHMIAAYGGVEAFYKQCYFTSVSPLGFTMGGKNLNYYDLRELQDTWEQFMVDSLKIQIDFGACDQAFALGQGKNYKYLQYLNQKYRLFDKIHPLPHPRWIMQYRLKRLDEFTQLYCNRIRSASCSY